VSGKNCGLSLDIIQNKNIRLIGMIAFAAEDKRPFVVILGSI